MGNLKETPWTEVVATLEALAYAGATREDFKRLRSDENFARRVAELIAEDAREISNPFHTQVNYDLRLEAVIKARKYDWINPNINEKNFPSNPKKRGQHELDICLVHFNRVMPSESILKELNKMGLRPVELLELLAFREKYPEEQKKYPIVALGSTWQYCGGCRDVPYLLWYGVERGLHLHWFEGCWDAVYRFAAVSKSR